MQRGIGAGAVVVRNVPPNAIVHGNPARIMGYVGVKGRAVPAVTETAPTRPSVHPSSGPGVNLHLPPGTWGVQYRYTAKAMLAAFASEYYDASGYIRDYEESRALRATR